jgi:hypothetical protein
MPLGALSNIILFLEKYENMLIVSKKTKWSTTSITSTIGTSLLHCLEFQREYLWEKI